MRSYNPFALLSLFLVLVCMAFYAGMVVGKGSTTGTGSVLGIQNADGDALSVGVNQEDVDFAPYWRTWNTLEQKFVPFGTSTAEDVPLDERMFRSIEGLVASYKDPYTTFMRPEVAEEFKIITKGSLEGIGAIIAEHEGGIFVVAPVPGSPAERAGLLPQDRIARIGGEETEGMTVDEAVSKIRGEAGTEIVLSIVREGKESTDVSVTRGTIEIPSTKTALLTRDVPVPPKQQPEDIGSPSDETEPDQPVSTEPAETEQKDFFVLQLFSFSETSIDAFRRELEAYLASDADSLIIDLRGNPGGYLDAAVDMASWFLPEGTPVVIEQTGPLKQERVHRANGHMLVGEDMPTIAVLIDRGSASASEILAGALKDHGVATLVGERSFGKGSVQELVPITKELSLKVTVARWLTPNRNSISEGGLIPDVPIDQAAKEQATSSDPFIDAAISTLSRSTT